MIYECNAIHPRQQYNPIETIFQIVRIIIATANYSDYSTAGKLMLTCKKEITKSQINELERIKTYNELATEINKQTDDKLTIIKNKWYENEDWNEIVEKEFFIKLSKEKYISAIHCLRIQASLLLNNNDSRLQTIAIRLFDYIFKNYPTPSSEVAICHRILGHYYYKCGEYVLARNHYEEARRYYLINKPNDRLLVSVNLGIVATIITTHKINEIHYAQSLMEELARSIFKKNELEQYYFLQNKLNELSRCS